LAPPVDIHAAVRELGSYSGEIGLKSCLSHLEMLKNDPVHLTELTKKERIPESQAWVPGISLTLLVLHEFFGAGLGGHFV